MDFPNNQNPSVSGQIQPAVVRTYLYPAMVEFSRRMTENGRQNRTFKSDSPALRQFPVNSSCRNSAQRRLCGPRFIWSLRNVQCDRTHRQGGPPGRQTATVRTTLSLPPGIFDELLGRSRHAVSDTVSPRESDGGQLTDAYRSKQCDRVGPAWQLVVVHGITAARGSSLRGRSEEQRQFENDDCTGTA